MSSRSEANRKKTVEMPLFADGEAILHDTRDVLGRKWHPILVYRLLEDGPTGFSGLKQRVDGISSKMLSESLTDLEESGLVEREQVNSSPVRVEYTLTEYGRTLKPVLTEMIQWGANRPRNHRSETRAGGASDD